MGSGYLVPDEASKNLLVCYFSYLLIRALKMEPQSPERGRWSKLPSPSLTIHNFPIILCRPEKKNKKVFSTYAAHNFRLSKSFN